jgi:hypothetical protein
VAFLTGSSTPDLVAILPLHCGKIEFDGFFAGLHVRLRLHGILLSFDLVAIFAWLDSMRLLSPVDCRVSPPMATAIPESLCPETTTLKSTRPQEAATLQGV